MISGDVRRRVLEIQARAERATSGPWACFDSYAFDSYGPMHVNRIGPEDEGKGIFCYLHAHDMEGSAEDFEFIASARTDVPLLCELVLTLLDSIEGMKVPINMGLISNAALHPEDAPPH